MDNTVGFYPTNMGSIPVGQASLENLWKRGRVRFIAPVLKTDGSKGSVSSNLTVSAKHAVVAQLV